MKIGITTFQWSDNYGAVLQAHALQCFLQQRGHSVEIVDYRTRKPESWVRRWVAKTPFGCVRKWEAVWKKQRFEQFRRQHLIRTPDVFHSSSELRKISDRFDLLIAGSDQVWNPEWLAQVAGLSELYFLSFAGSKTRRISYAASIGHSSRATLTAEWADILCKKLLTIDAVSVRETSGVGLVKELCGRDDAVQVCDPTLLLDRQHYEALAGPVAAGGKKYLFSFMLHGLERDAEPVCRQIAGKEGWRVLKCDARRTALHKGFVLPSPAGWLRRIRDAEFVVTNSFHCTVFCLIFHIPFAAVLIGGQIGSMNSRIVDLLGAVGLANRMVSSGGGIPAAVLEKGIDWDAVDARMDAMRPGAVEFLVGQGV